MNNMMKDIIIMALEHEAPKMSKWENVFFSGVGKVNAALTAGKLIERYQPRTVWNFGTAGGIKFDNGCHEMKNFVERDNPYGFISGPEAMALLPTDPKIISWGMGYTCSTGDNFVTDPNTLEDPAHVVDMEAYALAKVCKLEGINFRCFKFISDSADDNASKYWIENCKKGAKLFQIKKKEL